MPLGGNTVFAIKEWTEKRMPLNNLVYGRERETSIMNNMAKLMDEEFVERSVFRTGKFVKSGDSINSYHPITSCGKASRYHP